ncbi:MAG: MopE-related protein [Nanoarchaeota archaeon]
MKKLITLLFALTIICSFSIAASIGDEGHAWISPAVREVGVGAPVSLILGANPGGTNVYTVDVELVFDGNKLSITPNDIVIQIPEWSFPVKEVVGNTIKLQGYDFLHPFSGSKDIATLTFNTLSTGVASLTLTKVLLQSNPAVITILESGQVTVVAAQPQQCTDLDGDSYGLNCPAGLDCNDNNPNVNPGKLGELCDSIDNNCNGNVDEGYNTLFDFDNCGACGNVCSQGESCSQGVCAAQPVDLQAVCQAAADINNSNDLNLLQGIITAIKNNPENRIDATIDIFVALNAWFAAQ